MTSRNPIKELRTQFTDQLKCLDSKLDLDVVVLSELHEFYRRRALVEHEYSDALTKLVNNLKTKHFNETGKRQNWVHYSTTGLWNTLIGTTLRLSDAHGTLSEVFGKHMVQRLADIDEDINRLHKQCRDMMLRGQEKVLTNVTKLQSDQREYCQRQITQSDASRVRQRSEDKLTYALNHLHSKNKEPEKSIKFRRAQADFNQKHQTYEDTAIAATRARNEYLIQLSAANQSITRYFADEVPDILDCMNCGLHNSLARAALMNLSCEEALKNCHSSVGEMINRNITTLDWRADKAAFFKHNEIAFSRPPAFSFTPLKEDTESKVLPVPPLRDSLASTTADLRANLEHLKSWTEKAWNDLQEIEKKLLLLINQNDYDVSELFAISMSSGIHRRKSGSLGNGSESSRPAIVASTASHLRNSNTALNKGAAFAGTPLSSSLPSEEGESRNPIDSRTNEIQPGLYLLMRNIYRDQRIKEERNYLERFSSYTEEMHRSVVMEAKLAEIEQAFASLRPLHDPTAQERLAGLSSSSAFWQSKLHAYGAPGISTEPAATTKPTAVSGGVGSSLAPVKTTPRRVLHVPNLGRPKLFGGTLEEYVTRSGEQIPCVVLSCIRVINLYGMHHQGIFRISGSQTEIANFKEAFEYGEDPLLGVSDSRYVNSTAGLLKLYFRELGEPAFPENVFLDLVNVIRDRRENDEDCVNRIAAVVSKALSHAVFIVMRYLFSFLHHLSEYSDENLMDPHNLAICFGPTVMPTPPNLDPLEHQASVTEVVKLLISQNRRIFDPTVLGAYYEKFAASFSSSRVPPVLPRTIAHQAAQKAVSLRRYFAAAETFHQRSSSHELADRQIRRKQ